MIKAHKIRLYPTPEQANYFRRAGGVARFVFNWGLAEWRKQYEAGGQPSALKLKAAFNAIKHEQFPFVLEVTKTVSEGAFVNLGKAFAHFFRSVKKGQPRGYPKFKSRKRSLASFYIANDRIKFDGHWVQIPKLGWVNMTEPLRWEGKVMGATVSEAAGWWWLSIQVEVADPPLQRQDSQAVGLDLGLHDRATTSDGQRFENQKHLKASWRRLRGLQRSLSRKVKGSANYRKAQLKLSRAHFRVRCQRSDVLHKLTTKLCQEYRVIGIEDLNVSGMVRNHSLAQSISDAAFGELRRQLEYKGLWYGTVIQTVGCFFPSSQLCSECGWRNQALRLQDREWDCQNCSIHHHRDVNAAVNIRNEAVRLIRAGNGYIGTLNSPVDSIALAPSSDGVKLSG
jgi:putative transposase